MKKYKIFMAIVVLLLASLACQTVMGGSASDYESDAPVEGTGDSDSEPDEDASDGGETATNLPLTDDASNVVEVAGTVNYQTDLSIDEVIEFYRDYYASEGYSEREILTVISDGTFSIVFDGDPSGQSVVIQGVDLGDGTTNVNIRLEMVN